MRLALLALALSFAATTAAPPATARDATRIPDAAMTQAASLRT